MNEFLKKKQTRIILAAIGMLLCVGYCFFVLCLFARIPLNSDIANMMLEAEDILNGNLFLSDWILTGISFVTTDLLYFIAGTLLFGVSMKGYVASVTLMFLALTAAGLLLISDRCHWLELLFFLAVCGFPCFFWASISRVHTGCFVWVFVGLFFLYRANHYEKHQKLTSCFSILFLAFAVTGDSIALLAVILPLFIVSLANMVRSWISGNSFQKTDLRSIVVGASAFLLGTVLDKLYFFIGGANKNVFLENKTFAPFASYPHNFQVYCEALFGMFDAQFAEQKLLSVHTLFFFIRGCIIFLGLIAIFHTLFCFLKRKAYDFINLILSLGFVLISAVFLLTDISVDITCGRYFVYAPVLFCVILIREACILRERQTNLRTKQLAKAATALCSVALLLDSIFPIPVQAVYYDETQLGLIQTLEEHHLKNGYGGFWDASLATVYSNNQLTVRSVITNGNSVCQFQWFCSNSWYDKYADYIIINTRDNSVLGISADSVVQSFGTPAEIIPYGIYEIYVYDYDISKRLVK